MSGVGPMCRNCLHARWTMGPGGKTIKQRTPGECTKQAELTTTALQATHWPAIQVLVGKGVIWPTTKARKCPGFEAKQVVNP